MGFSEVFLICWLALHIAIIAYDIRYRRIPNTLLLPLIACLPVWYLIFPIGSTSQMVISSVLFTLLLGFGVFSYRKDGFLGAGDIKYAAILTLFLSTHSLSVWVGNIGVITVLTLIVWVVLILGQIIALRAYIPRNLDEVFGTLTLKKFLIHARNWSLDWIIIGFFLSLTIRHIYTFLYSGLSLEGDFYFFLSLMIFLVRPYIRYALTEWKHRVWVILAMTLYFGYFIERNGGTILWQEHVTYMTNIWMYAVIFTLLQGGSKVVFQTYDAIEKIISGDGRHATIPYSAVISLAFFSLFFYDINLMKFLRSLLLF